MDVFDSLGDRPILYDLHFRFIHLNAIGANYEAQEVGGVNAELALLDLRIETVSSKSAQDFAHMRGMLDRVLGVDKYVVKVYGHAHIQEILEYIVHEALE